MPNQPTKERVDMDHQQRADPYEVLRHSSQRGLTEVDLEHITLWRCGRKSKADQEDEPGLEQETGLVAHFVEETDFLSLSDLVREVDERRLLTKNPENPDNPLNPSWDPYAYSKFLADGAMPLIKNLFDPARKKVVLGLKMNRNGSLRDKFEIDETINRGLLPYLTDYLVLKQQLTPQDLQVLLLQENIFKPLLELTFGKEALHQRKMFFANFDLERDAKNMYLAMLKTSFDKGYTDIHLEPERDGGVIRYRKDGVLKHSSHRYPEKPFLALVNIVKTRSGMDIAEKRKPQDGSIIFGSNRFGISDEETVDAEKGYTDHSLRVSVLPVLYGERVAMRVLNLKQKFDLGKLGYPERVYTKIRKAVAAPNGLFLVTGPTGSGKTTTLYSILQELKDPKWNIMTAEDPIEIPLPGISQTSVRHDISGMDFAGLLRTFLRQDPDIIFVGEIRDSETAKIAAQAAKTGHLVLSTLHTNDSTQSSSRLLDFGIDRSDLENYLRAVVAQRLVPKICPGCSKAYDGREDFNRLFGRKIFTERDVIPVLYREEPNINCPNCDGRGFAGRLPVTEIWVPGREERALLRKGENASEVYRQVALKNGMETLARSGTELIIKGQTSFEHISEAVEDEQFEYEADLIVPFIRTLLAEQPSGGYIQGVKKAFNDKYNAK